MYRQKSLKSELRYAPGKHALLICVCVSLTGLFPVLTTAQGNILEEVVVTAQKREQSLQDVPISVAVTSGGKHRETELDRPR